MDCKPLRTRLRLLLAAAALACVAASARAAPVALVTDIVGDVRQGAEPLRLLAEIEGGREVVLAQDASAVVFYVGDGSEWLLKGPGRYRLTGKGPEPQGAAAVAQRRPAPPAFRDIKLRPDRVRQAAVIMRGQDLRLTSPHNGDLVLDDTVRLAWELRNARDLEFEVEMVDSAGTRLFKETTKAFELPLPSQTQLRPGQRYTWAVLARAPGMPQPYYRVAEFQLADAATRRRVEDARPKSGAPFSERVLFVALLEHLGAVGAADEQRRLLAAERPAAWASTR